LILRRFNARATRAHNGVRDPVLARASQVLCTLSQGGAT
jgi:hypothetical protein